MWKVASYIFLFRTTSFSHRPWCDLCENGKAEYCFSAQVVFTQTWVSFVWKWKAKQKTAQVVYTQTLVISAWKWKAKHVFFGPSHFQTDLSKICAQMESHFAFPAQVFFTQTLVRSVWKVKSFLFFPAHVVFTQTLVGSMRKWKDNYLFPAHVVFTHTLVGSVWKVES